MAVKPETQLSFPKRLTQQDVKTYPGIDSRWVGRWAVFTSGQPIVCGTQQEAVELSAMMNRCPA